MPKPGPARIEALYRYPVKGLTPEPLESVELATAVIPAQAFALVIPAGAKRRAGTQEQRGSGSRVSQGGSPGMTSKYRNKARACGRLRAAESHAPKEQEPRMRGSCSYSVSSFAAGGGAAGASVGSSRRGRRTGRRRKAGCSCCSTGAGAAACGGATAAGRSITGCG